MLRRALKNGFVAKYLLADKWFFGKDFFHEVRNIRKGKAISPHADATRACMYVSVPNMMAFLCSFSSSVMERVPNTRWWWRPPWSWVSCLPSNCTRFAGILKSCSSRQSSICNSEGVKAPIWMPRLLIAHWHSSPTLSYPWERGSLTMRRLEISFGTLGMGC